MWEVTITIDFVSQQKQAVMLLLLLNFWCEMMALLSVWLQKENQSAMAAHCMFGSQSLEIGRSSPKLCALSTVVFDCCVCLSPRCQTPFHAMFESLLEGANFQCLSCSEWVGLHTSPQNSFATRGHTFSSFTLTVRTSGHSDSAWKRCVLGHTDRSLILGKTPIFETFVRKVLVAHCQKVQSHEHIQNVHSSGPQKCFEL